MLNVLVQILNSVYSVSHTLFRLPIVGQQYIDIRIFFILITIIQNNVLMFFECIFYTS